MSGQKKGKKVYYYNQVKLEKSSYTTGFSIEFEVN